VSGTVRALLDDGRATVELDAAGKRKRAQEVEVESDRLWAAPAFAAAPAEVQPGFPVRVQFDDQWCFCVVARVAPGGSLQLTVLKHSLRIHNIRQEALPEHLRLLQYRLAMWADERKEASKRRYAKEQARAAAAGAGNGSANLGAPAGPAPGSGGATLLPPEPQPRPADPADPVLEHDDGPEDDENQ
jgi:hypothetical protein